MKRSPRRKSNMVHDFSRIERANIPRSKFKRPMTHKFAFDSGYLVPFYIDEVIPGDTHTVRPTAFVRMATPLHPTLDNLHVEYFFFFCPNRLVWTNFVKMMGEQEDPGDSTDYTVPVIFNGNTENDMLEDYMGIPPLLLRTGAEISALPFRMYNLIYNTWFRSEDLQDSRNVPTDDGPDNFANNQYDMQRRGKRHDYLSSALPWPQKGPGVDLPLGVTAPVGVADTSGGVSAAAWSIADSEYKLTTSAAVPNPWIISDTTNTGDEELVADLSQATAATINDLRQAFQIQKLQERDARGGTRYQELVLAHFGVRGGDARLNRPEYLGGGSSPVNITQVPQTSEDGTTPQGHLTAYATSSIHGGGFTKSFVEHGYIIGLINVRADITYQQGLHRHWNRQTKYDFYFPALAHLGEQTVYNKEIYWQADSAGANQDNAAFGYQERWSELRYGQSRVSSLFRSVRTGSLDPWHLALDFASLPLLDATFIEDNPPVSRIVAVPSEPEFLCDAYFDVTSVRPLPTYSTPGYIDHF